MIDDLATLLGVSGYEYILLWVALCIITIGIYCLFKVLLTILLRVGGYE